MHDQLVTKVNSIDISKLVQKKEIQHKKIKSLKTKYIPMITLPLLLILINKEKIRKYLKKLNLQTSSLCNFFW